MSAFAPNAFSGAIDDLFADPNLAVTVLYQDRSIRALVRQPDRDLQFGDIAIRPAGRNDPGVGQQIADALARSNGMDAAPIDPIKGIGDHQNGRGHAPSPWKR